MNKNPKLKAALEDIDAEIEIEITEEADEAGLDTGEPGQMSDLDFEESQEESVAEDAGAEELTEALVALEGIDDMIKALPAVNGKIAASIMSGVKIACEANDLVAANSTALTAGGDKAEARGNFRDAINKILEMLKKMALGFVETVKSLWAQATDKLVRAAKKAEAMKGTIGATKFNGNAAITDEKLGTYFATEGNIGVRQALTNTFDFVQAVGGQVSGNLMNSAGGALVEASSAGASGTGGKIAQLHSAITGLGKIYPESVQVENGDASASKPFFAGMRAWVKIPTDVESIDKFSHGITKVAEVGSAGNQNAGNQSELNAICDVIINGNKLVQGFRKALNDEIKLAKQVGSISAPADASDETRKTISKLNSVLPKVIKGPQVAAYNYAGTAASIAVRYVEASLKAHNVDANETKKLDAPQATGTAVVPA